MPEKEFVLLLTMKGEAAPLGYWDGKIYYNTGEPFPGALEEIGHPRAKGYKTMNGAKKAKARALAHLPQLQNIKIESRG